MYMRITALAACLLCCTWVGNAQKLQKGDIIQFSYSTQYNLNTRNIENDDKLPNPLSTKNSFGQKYGLGYQHVFKNGLAVGATIRMGRQEHLVEVDYDFSRFDPAATKALTGAQYHKDYGLKTWFFNPRVTIGYMRELTFAKNGWYMEGAVGLSIKKYASKMNPVNEGAIITYRLDDEPVSRGIYFYHITCLIGNDKLNMNPTRVDNSSAKHIEAYLGLRKTLKSGVLKSLYAGLEFSRVLTSNKRYEYVMVRSFASNENQISTDYYYDKGIAVGLVLLHLQHYGRVFPAVLFVFCNNGLRDREGDRGDSNSY
jgi:hypothetical protein